MNTKRTKTDRLLDFLMSGNDITEGRHVAASVSKI